MAEPGGEVTAQIVHRAEAMGGARRLDVRPLPGGRSGLTLVAEVDPARPQRRPGSHQGDGNRSRSAGRHDVFRQAGGGIAHAAVGLAVPQVLATSAEDPLFFLMSFEEGEPPSRRTTNRRAAMMPTSWRPGSPPPPSSSPGSIASTGGRCSRPARRRRT